MNNLSDEKITFVRTPVRIEGHEALALVDSAAHSFLGKSFADRHGIQYSAMPADASSTIDSQGISRKMIGVAEIKVENGERTVQMQVSILDPSKDDLIIGYDYFKQFRLSLNGVPTKLPGPGTVQAILDTAEDDSDSMEQSVSEGEIDPRIEDALKRNSQIDPLSMCTHPLAVWKVEYKEQPQIWAKRNFIRPADLPEIREQVKTWLEKGVTAAIVPRGVLQCFPLLAVLTLKIVKKSVDMLGSPK